MTGCSDVNGQGSVTSWGWRGDNRLWRIRRDGALLAEVAMTTSDPCEALMIWCEARDWFQGKAWWL